MANPILNPTNNFGSVPEALAPLSANTQGTICVHDCNGNTVVITPPNPTFTNGKGKAVVQLNLTQLGGENGLYI